MQLALRRDKPKHALLRSGLHAQLVADGIFDWPRVRTAEMDPDTMYSNCKLCLAYAHYCFKRGVPRMHGDCIAVYIRSHLAEFNTFRLLACKNCIRSNIFRWVICNWINLRKCIPKMGPESRLAAFPLARSTFLYSCSTFTVHCKKRPSFPGLNP